MVIKKIIPIDVYGEGGGIVIGLSAIQDILDIYLSITLPADCIDRTDLDIIGKHAFKGVFYLVRV